MTAFTAAASAPQTGRVALVTGANTGIGRVTARELARAGARVFIACRSAERAQDALSEIRAAAAQGGSVELLQLDLGDFASVRACAQDFLARGLPLHLLVNNAGLAGARGLSQGRGRPWPSPAMAATQVASMRGLSPSGFELTFGVNHLGTFLFTQLLLDRLKASAPARIVTVASRAHTRVRGIDFAVLRQPTQGTGGLPEYGVSKLANVLFSAELGRRLAGTGVSTYALHPGVVATDVWRQVPGPLRWLMKLGMISAEEGARTTLHCATAPARAGESGLYYDKCQPVAPSAAGQDRALAAELWRRSEDWVR